MKMREKAVLVSFFLCAALSGSELVKNGEFEKDLDSWKISGKVMFDKQNKVAGGQSVKFAKKQGAHFNEFWQTVNLKPDKEYELSYYVKGENIVKNIENAKVFGVSCTLQSEKRKLSYGSSGLWKYDGGTFDWKKVSVKFEANDFGNGPLRVGIQFPNASGTAWVDSFSVKEIVHTPYRITLFPIKYLGGQPYTIAENLIGTLFLTSTPEQYKKYHGKKYNQNTDAVMTLELPDFLRLAGVTDRYILKRNGKFSQAVYPIEVAPVKRDGMNYRRYTVTFDNRFAPLLGAGWYYQKIFLVPEKNSAGKKGIIAWSFKIGGDIQKEEKYPVEVNPPIIASAPPCKRFNFDVGYSSVDVSPFDDLKPVMSKFWKTLVEKPSLQLDIGSGYNPEYDVKCVLIGDDTMVDIPFGRDAIREYRVKAPANVMITGRKQETPSWFKLEDPDKLYENYLRSSLRQALRDCPQIKYFKWDYEPERGGYDPEGRARFAKTMKLGNVPSIDEIKSKYRAEWNKYTLELNAKFIAKVARIVKEEAPQCKFVFVSIAPKPSGSAHSGWCDVDMRMVDDNPDIDLFEGMPYITGTAFFDEITTSTSTLKKPMTFAQDPSERIWSYFSKYTAPRLKQNIVAVAALGGKGICHWPDDSMTAEYYKAFSEAYGILSKYENVYFDGRRIDREFKLDPQNVISKIISNGNRKVRIDFPDFKNSLRMTAHEYKGKYYLTIFNYNEKEAVILKITGRGINLLAKIPADGVEIIEAGAPQDQTTLSKELAEFKKTVEKTSIRELNDGVNSVSWKLGNSGKPVMRLANLNFKADIDALGKCELVGLQNKSGANPFTENGSAARLMFYDTDQPPVTFKMEDITLENGNPSASFTAIVPAYEGAVPHENPLLGLRITRTFTLEKNELKVNLSFFNPSKREMEFGFRVWNHPQTGAGFGRRNLTAECENVKITPKDVENTYFLRSSVTDVPVNVKNVRRPWNGGKAVSSASDKTLKERIEFIPDSKFTGILVWNSQSTVHSHTIEFLSPVIKLKPGKRADFTFTLK